MAHVRVVRDVGGERIPKEKKVQRAKFYLFLPSQGKEGVGMEKRTSPEGWGL